MMSRMLIDCCLGQILQTCVGEAVCSLASPYGKKDFQIFV